MIPELHIFLGIMNSLVQNLNELWEGENEFFKWCAKVAIKSEDYW